MKLPTANDFVLFCLP